MKSKLIGKIKPVNLVEMCSLCGGGDDCSCGSCGVCNCGSCDSSTNSSEKMWF